MKNVLLFLICSAAAAQDQTGQWSATGALMTPRRDHCLASLQDGRVLATGGIGPEGTLHGAEIYSDPSFAPAAHMASARSSHTCTVLPDGRVLVVGGREGDSAVAGAEIFDPTAGAWSAAANASLARWGHTATLLSDGSVLIAGGENENGPTGVLERFNPIANTFTTLASTLPFPRKLHAAALLPDGRVLIAGGNDGAHDLTSVQWIDAFGDTVARGPDLPQPRSGAGAIALVDGRVLLLGGVSAGTDLSSTLIFDPASATFSSGPALAVARSGAQVVRIPNNGSVLVIGGTSKGAPTASTELFDAVIGQFKPYGNLTVAREGLSAAPIGNSGSILAAGGAINEIPIAGCGKTTTPPAITTDKPIYLVGQQAVISATWGILKENITVTVQLTPVSGSPTTQIINTADLTNSSFTVTTNPLTGPSTGLVTAVGTVTGLTLTTTFKVDLDSTLTFLTPNPVSPALVRQPVTFSVKLHPSAPTTGAFSGNVILLEGQSVLATVSTTDTKGFQIDRSGDGIATFSFPNGFTDFGLHTFNAQFRANSSSVVASSATSSPLSYGVDRRTVAFNISVKNPPPRIHDIFDLLMIAPPASGLPLPTGNMSIIEGSTTLGTLPLVQPSGFTFDPASTADIHIVAGAVPGPRTFSVHYEGDANYAPQTITHIEEMRGVIPNVKVNSVTAPSPGLTVDQPATVSVTFTPVAGIDPWANNICSPATNCQFSYEVSAGLQENGLSVPAFGIPVNLPNTPFFGFAPDNDGHPLTVNVSIIPRAVGPATVTASLSCIVAPGPVAPLQLLRTNYDCFTTPPFSFTVPFKGNGGFTVSATSSNFPSRVANVTVDSGGRPLTGTFQLVEGTTVLTSTQIPPSATLSGTGLFTMTVSTTQGSHTYSVLYSGDANYNPSSATVTVVVP